MSVVAHPLNVRHRLYLLSLVLPPLVGIGGNARAQMSVWVGPDIGSWSEVANWDPDIPNSTTSIASFGTQGPAGLGIVTVEDSVDLSALTMADGQSLILQGAGRLLFSGLAEDAIAVRDPFSLLVVNNGIASQNEAPLVMNVAESAVLQLGGGLGVSGSPITKTGPGAMWLLGSNGNWTAPLRIEGGTVAISSSDALGNGGDVASGSYVGPSARLEIGDRVTQLRESIQLDGGHLSTLASGLTLPQQIHVSSPSSLKVPEESRLNLQEGFSGSGDVSLFGGQIVVGASAPGYSGRLTVNSGELEVNATNSLGTQSGTPADGTTLMPGTTLRFDDTGRLAGEWLRADNALIEFTASATPEFKGNITLVGQTVLSSDSKSQLYFQGHWSGSGGITYQDVEDDLVFDQSGDYEGPTIFRDVSAIARQAGALGGAEGETFLVGSTLTLQHDAIGDESINVDARSLLKIVSDFSDFVYDGDLRLAGGDVEIRSSRPRTATINGMIEVEGRARFRPRSSNVTLEIRGDIVGQGTLDLGGNIYGEVDPRIDLEASGMVHLFRPGTYSQKIRGNVRAEADIQLDDFQFGEFGFRLESSDSAQITLPNLNLPRATIDANIVYDKTLVINDRVGPTLIRLGAGFDEDIVIQRGSVHVAGNNGLGSAIGKTTIQPGSTGQIRIQESLELDETIELNNGRGPAWTGALFTSHDNNVSNVSTLRGTLDLGENGAYVGHDVDGGTVALRLAGPIVGGDLIQRNGDLSIVAEDNAQYTGSTVVGGRFVIAEAGALHNTSEIVINHEYAEFIIGDPETTQSDRVGDSIPIRLRGGTLLIDGPRGEVVTETLGSVYVEQNDTRIWTRSGDAQGHLILGSLTREPGATVEALGHVDVLDPPEMQHGILPAWIRGSAGFVKLVGTEIVSEPGVEKPLSAGASGDHIDLDGDDLLTSDVTVASLQTNGGDQVDLGGHLLTLQTGGLVSGHSSSSRRLHLANGRITSGVDELLLYGQTTIGANIVDSGPTPMNLVVAGGSSRVSGINTYSGSTTLNRGGLIVENEQALPADADVEINAGTLSLRGSFRLGDIKLRDGGKIRVDEGDFQATGIHAESGIITGGLAGDAPIVKTGPGTLTFDRAHPGYTGTISLNQGVIISRVAESTGVGPIIVNPDGVLAISDGLSNPIVLNGGSIWGGGQIDDLHIGDLHVAAESWLTNLDITDPSAATGLNIVLTRPLTGPGDLRVDVENESVRLVTPNADYTGALRIVSGALAIGHPDALRANRTTVIEEFGGLRFATDQPVRGAFELHGSTIDREDVLNGRSSRFAGELDLSGDITLRLGTYRFEGMITMSDDAVLTISPRTVATIGGDLFVGKNNEIAVTLPRYYEYDLKTELSMKGTIVATTDQSTLNFQAAESLVDLDAFQLDIPSQTSLRITKNGEPFLLRIGADAHFLTGAGIIAQDVQLGALGVLSPGDSIGTLTVDGELILAGGAMDWEIRSADVTRVENGADQIHIGGPVRTANVGAPTQIQMHPVNEFGQPAPLPSFDPFAEYTWPLITGADASLVDISQLTLQADEFYQHHALARRGVFEFRVEDNAILLDYRIPQALGDFDNNGLLEAADVDQILQAIALDEYRIQHDINLDAAVDTIDLMIWVERIRKTYLGDANLDGEFDSGDIVHVGAAGQYEDDVAGNSGWATGDWNGDLEFDSGDLVFALASGGYEQGPRSAVSRAMAVPEPALVNSLAFILLVSSFMCHRRGIRRSGLACFFQGRQH